VVVLQRVAVVTDAAAPTQRSAGAGETTVPPAAATTMMTATGADHEAIAMQDAATGTESGMGTDTLPTGGVTSGTVTDTAVTGTATGKTVLPAIRTGEGARRAAGEDKHAWQLLGTRFATRVRKPPREWLLSRPCRSTAHAGV
jgi:hypothetical protein